MYTLRGSKFVPIIIFAGAVLLTGSSITWLRVVYASPTNVFNRMLTTSLSSPSVERKTTQADDSQKLDQAFLLTTQPSQLTRSLSTLNQTTDTKSSITTESIGTPTTDFVRYTNIKTSEKNEQGGDFDFSSVVGLWGKTDTANPNSGGAQSFSQSALGVVPIAMLTPTQRGALLTQIQKDSVYTFDKNSVKRGMVSGRPVYSYNVSISPKAYVSMLKTFAQNLGLKQLEDVDPMQYADSKPIRFIFDIDVLSGQLTKVAYKGSPRVETYSAYGVRSPILVPNSAITVDELQTRLQQIR